MVKFAYGENYEKRRKCCLPAFFSFPTIISKDIHLKVVNAQDYMVSGKSFTFVSTIKDQVHVILNLSL